MLAESAATGIPCIEVKDVEGWTTGDHRRGNVMRCDFEALLVECGCYFYSKQPQWRKMAGRRRADLCFIFSFYFFCA